MILLYALRAKSLLNLSKYTLGILLLCIVTFSVKIVINIKKVKQLIYCVDF